VGARARVVASESDAQYLKERTSETPRLRAVLEVESTGTLRLIRNARKAPTSDSELRGAFAARLTVRAGRVLARLRPNADHPIGPKARLTRHCFFLAKATVAAEAGSSRVTSRVRRSDFEATFAVHGSARRSRSARMCARTTSRDDRFRSGFSAPPTIAPARGGRPVAGPRTIATPGGSRHERRDQTSALRRTRAPARVVARQLLPCGRGRRPMLRAGSLRHESCVGAKGLPSVAAPAGRGSTW
jgi:hypothetical protein